MGFFKGASNFTVGSATTNEVASGATVTYTINNGSLLPPSAVQGAQAQAPTHIPVQVNRSSSAPEAIPGLAPASTPRAPQFATAHSSPAASTAKDTADSLAPVRAATTQLGPASPGTLSSRSSPIPSPPPSPRPTACSVSPGPSNNNAQALESSPAHQRPSRPQLNPLRTDFTSPQVDTLDEDSPPRLRYGIVAAVGAQAHLQHKTQIIGSLLKAHGIGVENWVGQSGFRLDSSGDGHPMELPSNLRQEIIISIYDSHIAKKKLPELLPGLRKHVAPYFGTIKFLDSGKTWDLQSNGKEVAEWKSSRDIFNPECSRAHESLFDVEAPDAVDGPQDSFVALTAINIEDDNDPQNHFSTSVELKLEKDDKSPEGSRASGIKCSELKLKGPTSYSLQGVSVRFALDQPSQFREVAPTEIYEIGPQLRDSTQRAKKGTKLTQGVGAQASQVAELDGMGGMEEAENAWLVRHSIGKACQAVHYSSPLPAVRQGASFSEKLRPSVKFNSNTKRYPPTTITVRIVSFWTSKAEADRGPVRLLDRVWPSVFGMKSQHAGERAAARAYTNVAYCVEIAMPLSFMGSATETVVQNDVLETLV